VVAWGESRVGKGAKPKGGREIEERARPRKEREREREREREEDGRPFSPSVRLSLAYFSFSLVP
jgi:hypothetical protein